MERTIRQISIWFLAILLASCSTVPSLPGVGRLPISASDVWYVNYVNIQTQCGILSVTVYHVSPYIEAAPLAEDERNDIVIYKQLGPGPVYPVASELPQPGDILLMVGQYYKQEAYFWARVVGLLEGQADGVLYIALDGVGYPGLSGSPAFNTAGEYVGSMSAGHVSGMGYSGLSFLTRTDLIHAAIEKACRA